MTSWRNLRGTNRDCSWVWTFFLLKLYLVKLLKNIFPQFQNSSSRTGCAVHVTVQLCCARRSARPFATVARFRVKFLSHLTNYLEYTCIFPIHIKALNNLGLSTQQSGYYQVAQLSANLAFLTHGCGRLAPRNPVFLFLYPQFFFPLNLNGIA